MQSLKAACLLFSAIVSLGIASAQRETEVFEPAYFERFAPQTALDMLRQVPGFSVRSTGGGRGLGQGGTNVLINGERITSKDTNVIDILSQTPVQAVVRIEVADAASLGVTGLNGQVANVVLDRSEFSGSFEWEPTFRREVRPRLTAGAVSVSGTVKKLDYTLGIQNEAWRGFERGPETRSAADGTIVDVRQEEENTRLEAVTVTMALNYDISPRTDLSVTGSATSFAFEGREISEGFDDTRVSISGEDEWNADLSAELAHKWGPGTLRLIGYHRFERSPTINKNITTFTDEPTETAIFDQLADESESIFRSEYAWPTDGGGSWEVAAESAFNLLDVESFVLFDDGTNAITDIIPATRVDELRNQASLTRGFSLGERLSIQASLAGEWSRITVESDSASREETFLRPKGLVSLSYPWTDTLDIRGRLERSVGQLSFFQFINSVDLTEDRGFSGNTNLVPQQAWIGEVELEKRFGTDEKIILRAIGRQIEDRVDRILINGQDAVGNVDEASSLTLQTEGTLLLDRWSVEGGRVDYIYSHFSSRIEDQITGRQRGFNDATDWFYEVSFRHDVPATPFAWGLEVTAEDDFSIVRFNERIRVSESTPAYSAFFEHKDLFGLNLRISGRNLANRDYDLDRVRFAGLLTESPIDVIESRSRIDNRRLQITLSGTF
ncbi:MAG: TonB-dependent receptor plug domain-containing protein [Pseudomonadota bacterium]